MNESLVDVQQDPSAMNNPRLFSFIRYVCLPYGIATEMLRMFEQIARPLMAGMALAFKRLTDG